MSIHSYQGQTPVLAKGAWIAPGAHVAGRVTLGEDVSIWYGAVLRADINTIEIGARSHEDRPSLPSLPAATTTESPLATALFTAASTWSAASWAKTSSWAMAPSSTPAESATTCSSAWVPSSWTEPRSATTA